MRHLGPKIWNILPQNIRESNSLNELKSLINLVDFAKATLLKWVLFDPTIYIEAVWLSFLVAIN